MKKSSVNLLKYGLAKHLKETAQIDINIDPVFASSKGVFSAVLTDMKKKGFGAVKPQGLATIFFIPRLL